MTWEPSKRVDYSQDHNKTQHSEEWTKFNLLGFSEKIDVIKDRLESLDRFTVPKKKTAIFLVKKEIVHAILLPYIIRQRKEDFNLESILQRLFKPATVDENASDSERLAAQAHYALNLPDDDMPLFEHVSDLLATHSSFKFEHFFFGLLQICNLPQESDRGHQHSSKSVLWLIDIGPESTEGC